MNITVYLPEVEDDYLSFNLIKLTEKIWNKFKDHSYTYGLGGEYGYGVNCENDTFMMHRFCWCDKDKCKWCYGDNPNFWHKPTDLKIWWYKYIGRSQKINQDVSIDKMERIFEDCVKSIIALESIE